ncbi:MBL fold metallo-hydrolase [Lentzea sp. NPDC042327]|uniref:MBL fold metallo-hydrolase n=1 Tax=Lentzea sp. NPDC042327 TaxID=3154801 RepID=UPI0033EC7597
MDVLENYTGHVEPGGPAASRTLPALTITKISVGPMDNNAYLLVCRSTNEALLIDAANDHERLSALLDQLPTRPALRTIVTTHQHADHWQALEPLATTHGCTTAAHELDAAVLPVAPDVLVDHNDTIDVGEVPLTVIHLRGHTPGSIAILYDDPDGRPHLFTGDSLFPGGVGKTTSPDNFASLINDVEDRVFAVLPDETWFYPGHGDDSTLGEQRPSLAEWRARGW